jgi:hypothetical protein
MRSLFYKPLLLALILGLGVTPLLSSQAAVTQAGSCWNDKIGWIDMVAVDYNNATRTFTGTALFSEGAYNGTTFINGEIDFTKQNGTSLGVLLGATADGSGNFPITGHAFSNQIGWVFADHGGTDPAVMTPSGELSGNFWSNTVGWLQCSGSEIGATNTQTWLFSTDDSDNDGITDIDEASICTSYPALTACTENDPETGIDPATDSDEDGIPDRVEAFNGDDPSDSDDPVSGGNNDTDNDGVTDGLEALIESLGGPAAPATTLTTDTDGDGIPDVIEIRNGTDLTDGDDPVSNGDGGDGPGGTPPVDTDNDGVSNGLESTLCTLYPAADNCPAGSPAHNITPGQDSDGDGTPDITELLAGTDLTDGDDPLNGGGSTTVAADSDDDGIPDSLEKNMCLLYPTLTGCPNPSATDDTDNDGIADYLEVLNGSDPTDINDPVVGGLIVNPATDSDSDGVPDIEEMNGNNGGDGNGDGIPDVRQSQVASVPNAATGKSVTIESVGGSCTVIQNAAGLTEASLATADPDYDYPVGIFDYRIGCANNGDSTTIRIYLDQAYVTGTWVLRKFDSNTNVFTTLSAVVTTLPTNDSIAASALGNGIKSGQNVTVIEYAIQDGDALDEDLTQNAVIEDPIGPAVSIAVASNSSGGNGGGATQNYPISACSKTQKQCVMVFPTRGNSMGTSFNAYQTCINTSSFTPQECTKTWANANAFQACGTDNDCPIPTTEAARDILGGAFDTTPQESIDNTLEATQADLVGIAPTNTCTTETFERLIQNRGQGVPAGMFSDANSRHQAYKYALDLGEQGIINGDDRTRNLRIDTPITRAEVSKIISRAAEHQFKQGDCVQNPFPDVMRASWYEGFVANLLERNIVSGYPEGLYKPAQVVTQAEMYKIAAITFSLITEAEAQAQIAGTQNFWYVPYARVVSNTVSVPNWYEQLPMGKAMTRGEVFTLVALLLANKDGVQID